MTLTRWGRVTHICVSNLTIISSDNGLSPGGRQTIIWTNAGILLIRNLGTNLSEILSEIHTFSFKKMHLKTSSAKWRPFCLGLNELINLLPAQRQPELTLGSVWNGTDGYELSYRVGAHLISQYTQHPPLFSGARRQYDDHHELRNLGPYSVLPYW